MKTYQLFNLGRTALLVGAFLSAIGFASAQETVKLAHGDRSFVEKAVKAGSEEVAISEVALVRSSNPQIKEFAQMMVSDHSAAGDALTALATTRGLTIPAKEMAPSKWSKKSGKDFDEDYIEKMVSDHEDAVKLFTKQANDGKDPELTGFARTTLPKLQHHLEAAKDLKKALKTS